MKRIKTIGKFVEFTSFVSWILPALLALPALFLKKALLGGQIKKMLVIPQLKIGDFVCQTPLFREIKKSHPESSLHVLVANPCLESIVKCDPHVDKIIVWPANADRFEKAKVLLKLMASSYDWSFNLAFQSWLDFIAVFALIPNRACLLAFKPEFVFEAFYRVSNTRCMLYDSSKFSTQVYLDMLGFISVESGDCVRTLYPCPQDHLAIRKLSEECGLDKKGYLVGIGISCGNKLKQWPEENFAELADSLTEKYGTKVVFTGSVEDRDIVKNIRSRMRHGSYDWSGLLSLGEFAAFCQQVDLFISVDSGPVYIACAVGAPVINIAGPFNISGQFTLSDKSKFVQRDLPCVPCSFVAPSARTCRCGHRECVVGIKAEHVLEKAREILQ